jgi:YrbI family 3-deoxy-D-manno-octulosonate 8-phosphate phosphatase
VVIREKAAKIKLLLLDVDGVLTDGRINLNDRGEEIKSFDVKDGLGLKMLKSCGVAVTISTARRSQVLEQRARELGIEGVYQGVSDKKRLCKQLKMVNRLETEAVCSMGDDLPDLAMFEESGLRIAVADAVREVRESADFITMHKGGFGAVREVCELLLKSQGKWEAAVGAITGK